MNKTATPEQLIRILAGTSYIDADDITLETAIGFFDFDSLEMVNVQLQIEGQFGVEIKDAEFLQCKTVADLLAAIRNA